MTSLTDFERQLLAFVNGRLLRDTTIDADARLFEDGHLDSLRVLELIAFVERLTDRKVPDRMVRLSTFRSVRAIAATFGGETPPVDADGERLDEYRAKVTHSDAIAETLRASGELHANDDGRFVLGGRAAALFDNFDATFVAWAEALGAETRELSSRIPISVLERAGFITAFPQMLVRDDDGDAFTPAACYHCYPEYAGRVIDREVLCVRATCHRNEHDTAPLDRQREFTMREIVVLGTRSDVERVRQDLIGRVGHFVRALGLDGFVETATDPFFSAESKHRRLTQRAGALKLELRLTLGGGRSIAVTSFNHHHDHFGSRFGIALADGTTANSGCVAFGLERWVLAFLTQLGLDETCWPPNTRAWLSDRSSGVRTA